MLPNNEVRVSQKTQVVGQSIIPRDITDQFTNAAASMFDPASDIALLRTRLTFLDWLS